MLGPMLYKHKDASRQDIPKNMSANKHVTDYTINKEEHKIKVENGATNTN